MFYAQLRQILAYKIIYKHSLYLPALCWVRVEGNHEQELLRRYSFLQGLPLLRPSRLKRARVYRERLTSRVLDVLYTHQLR